MERARTNGQVWWDFVLEHAPPGDTVTTASVARVLGMRKQRVWAVATGHEEATAEWVACALRDLVGCGWPRAVVITTPASPQPTMRIAVSG